MTHQKFEKYCKIGQSTQRVFNSNNKVNYDNAPTNAMGHFSENLSKEILSLVNYEHIVREDNSITTAIIYLVKA